MIVTTQHLYTVPNFRGGTGYCAKESRAWFATQGLNWSDFVAQGIEDSVLIATGDALALRVVEHARLSVETAQTQQQEVNNG